MNELFKSDYFRATGKEWKTYKIIRLKNNIGLRYLLYLRGEQQSSKGFVSYIYRFLRMHVQRKYGLDINSMNIGKGLFVGHAHNISINSQAVIGENVCVTSGVTIGKDFRGKRKGAPVIGNQVFCGANSTIVGKIVIGSDVLIAPNTFVNMDVPSHSIVIGVPGKIIHKYNATDGFIFNVTEGIYEKENNE